jgi:ATP/maltotriose-dependent transcriptional regulator MalT
MSLNFTEQQAKEYSESLGQIIGGAWRQIKWAHQMGIPKKLGLALDEWVKEYSGGYSKLSVSDRREAVIEMVNEGMSQREIAGVLGVGAGTVSRDLTVPNGTESHESPRETVPNGRAQ